MVDLARIDKILAFLPADIQPVHFSPSSANPAMRNVSRCAQVTLTQSRERPDMYELSATFETTPSRPTLQACAKISLPLTVKLLLN